jgi:glutathionylspermidine synthase
MCLQAVEYVIQENLFEQFQVPPPFVDYVKQSWERDEVSVYGRFDFAYDGRNPPKLLEYNADTPTALLEAAVIQWFWFQDQYPRLDQFNSIHERLIEAWRTVGQFMASSPTPAPPAPGSPEAVFFTALSDHLEDYMTANYLRDTAMQAGLVTHYLDVESVGWNTGRRRFVDEKERAISWCFKLYPWEWMTRERFAPHLLEARDTTRWLEPPWKMILSNKSILPVLFDLFPDSPYLLPASLEPLEGPHVRKPLLGREGANVTVVGEDGRVLTETGGDYEGPYVYQQLHPVPSFGGNYPIVGSWMVNGYACGIGVREDATPVTGNLSRFVPHVFSG